MLLSSLVASMRLTSSLSMSLICWHVIQHKQEMLTARSKIAGLHTGRDKLSVMRTVLRLLEQTPHFGHGLCSDRDQLVRDDFTTLDALTC